MPKNDTKISSSFLVRSSSLVCLFRELKKIVVSMRKYDRSYSFSQRVGLSLDLGMLLQAPLIFLRSKPMILANLLRSSPILL
jgi:hypothetical protein